MTTTFYLKWFDMECIRNLKFQPVIAIVGDHGSGKSFLIRDLLYQQSGFPGGAVISPKTEQRDGFYGKFVPKSFIQYNSEIIENVIKRQRSVLRQYRNQMHKAHLLTPALHKGPLEGPALLNGEPVADIDSRAKQSRECAKDSLVPEPLEPCAFIILDDCFTDNPLHWSRDKLMRLLITNNACWNIMTIMTLPYPFGVPPILYANIDYFFIFPYNTKKMRKQIYERHGDVFPTFEIFNQIMDKCEMHECIVIDNNSKSTSLEDKVFWYKASKIFV